MIQKAEQERNNAANIIAAEVRVLLDTKLDASWGKRVEGLRKLLDEWTTATETYLQANKSDENGPVHVVTFAEGCFEDHETFPTKIEARGFCKGFSSGAGHYGAGMAMAFIVPDDEKQMREYASDEYNPFEDGEIDKALRAVKGT